MARIDGTARADTLFGTRKADTISGRGGNDELFGYDGDDTLGGDAGDDMLWGGAGRNTLNGGGGIDTVSYADAIAALVIDLSTGRAESTDRMDTLASIERVVGGDFGDAITGSATADTLDGGGGDDRIAGGLGADTLAGGDGFDTLDYSAATAGVRIDLLSGQTFDQADTIDGFEAIRGSAFADNLLGSNDDNAFHGLDGDDVLFSSGGDNLLDGGLGLDSASYEFAAAAVTIDLRIAGPQANGSGGVDTLVGIEYLGGSRFDDRLTGTDAQNVFYGSAGSDRIDGGLNFDYVTYEFNTGPDGVTVNLRTGVARDGADTDRLTSIEGIIGSPFADTLIGGAGVNAFFTLAGADVLTGGGAGDFFFYAATIGSSVTTGVDRITDMTTDDVLDLAFIDANALVDGDQAFVRTDVFHNIAGEMTLVFDRVTKQTTLNGDVNGDGVADLTIVFDGNVTAFVGDWRL